MRVLGAFFALLYAFINPVMVVQVASEMEHFLSEHIGQENASASWIQRAHRKIDGAGMLPMLDAAVSAIVGGWCVVHVLVTGAALYAICATKPKWMYPLLADIAASTLALMMFVVFSLVASWLLERSPDQDIKEVEEAKRRQLRNIYIAAGFLLTYFVWAAITLSAYVDVRTTYKDLIFWDVEEREQLRRLGQQQRQHPSMETKSERSSKVSAKTVT